MSTAPCPGRNHFWDRQPAGPGAHCQRCGQAFGSRAKRNPPPVEPAQGEVYRVPKVNVSTGEVTILEATFPPPSDELAARRARNPALAARWAVSAQAESTHPPEAAPASPAESSAAGDAGTLSVTDAEAERLAEMLKPYVADGLLGVERWIIDWRGYVPKDIPEDQREELAECVEVILRRWLPDVAVGPYAKIGFVLAMSYAAMRVGAGKKPTEQKEPPALSRIGVEATAPKPETPPPSSPSPFAPRPASPLGASGPVEAAVPHA